MHTHCAKNKKTSNTDKHEKMLLMKQF